MEKSPAIGIDLGTTNCCVAFVENDDVKIIYNDLGNNFTPSYISFTDTDVLIGDLAKNNFYKNLKNTVYDVKRLVGRSFDDPFVQSDIKHWPFDVIDEDSKIKIKIKMLGEYEKFTPEELSGKLLVYLKKIAEDYLGETVKDAVISVPAYFSNSQRQATKYAGEIAGLNVLRIVNEPTAAAIAYGLKKNDDQIILIYDLGGGTFDVSIIEIIGDKLIVRAVGGNNHLGGRDFDRAMVEYCIADFKKKNGINIERDARAIMRLYHQCEIAKIFLSKIMQTTINIECLSAGIDFSLDITRAEFEKLNKKMFDSTMSLIGKCLKDAKLHRDDIDNVILIGGSSRIFIIEEMLKKYFNIAIIKKTINPDEAVARGAAIIAKQIRNSDVCLNDVTPISLGIGIIGGIMDVVILKNSKIPISVSRTYCTIFVNQTDMDFDIYEGEERQVKENKLLGSFSLSGITPASRGEKKCHVTFDIDVNGILNVHAKEENSQNENKIRITRSGLWSDAGIKGVVKSNKPEHHNRDKRMCKIFVGAE